jgi:SagB-type dehydrogenase family enzyme
MSFPSGEAYVVLAPRLQVFFSQNQLTLVTNLLEVKTDFVEFPWMELLKECIRPIQIKEIQKKFAVNHDVSKINQLLSYLLELKVIITASPYGAPTIMHEMTCYGNFLEPPILESSKTNNHDVSCIQNVDIRLLDDTFVKLLKSRISEREYGSDPLNVEALKEILWAAYGIKGSTISGEFSRNVPSAGGVYPLRFLIMPLYVTGLSLNIYEYLPYDHEFYQLHDVVVPKSLKNWFRTRHIDFRSVATIIFIVGNLHRMHARYGDRGYRYILIEAGHCGQNICLSCASLNLKHVTIGGFDDQLVHEGLHLTENEVPLYCVVIGKQ